MLKTYRASCHCGKVAVEASLDLDQPSYRCNCSICRRNRFWPAIATPDHFRILSGEDALTTFEFNKHIIKHKFCKVCGVQPFAIGRNPKTGTDVAAVNVRTIDGIDINSLNVTQVDGRSF